MMKKCMMRVLAICMILVFTAMCSVPAVFADESTTTMQTAYKDLSDHTEIYVRTSSRGSSYPYYGAKYEPDGGVLYGRTARGGNLPGGGFGLVNQYEVADESVISYYHGLSDEYSLEYWSYIYGPALQDGEHAFMVYLNFDREADDCAAVTAGYYDDFLLEMLTCMRDMTHPVFLRIGGEVNIWANLSSPQQFIDAYRYIGQMTYAVAPNVALVFSPNYSSGYKVDMDSFYPGDDYVDWVGVSLYYDRYARNHDTSRDEFYGVGDVYGDPMLNVQQTINLAALHNKPVMVTEGGPNNDTGSEDLSWWAAERLQKEFAFLPMVYPQVKCMITSDYLAPEGGADYTFYDNPVVTSAYRQAISDTGVYLSDYHEKGAYLTPLSDSPDLTWDNSAEVVFTAYTYSPSKLTATWEVDGQTVGVSSNYPYCVTLDRAGLLSGSHTVSVKFSNGQSKTYYVNAGRVQSTPVNGAVSSGGGNGAMPSGGGNENASSGTVNKDMPSDWAVESVNAAISEGIVPYSLQNNYTGTTTRAEFTALAVALYETVTGTEITTRKSFNDTDDVNVEKMASLGVVNGVGGGKFAPDQPLTREQAAKMLAGLSNVLGSPLPERDLNFSDNTAISDWAVPFVRQVYGAGIMSGTGNNNFSPISPYSKEQSIVTMLRLYQYLMQV